jgi:hypothetical protein
VTDFVQIKVLSSLSVTLTYISTESQLLASLLSNTNENAFPTYGCASRRGDFKLVINHDIFYGSTALYGSGPPRFRRGFMITHLRHTTVGRTPLNEGPARRRDLYRTTHNTHKRQPSMPPVGFFFLACPGFFPL